MSDYRHSAVIRRNQERPGADAQLVGYTGSGPLHRVRHGTKHHTYVTECGRELRLSAFRLSAIDPDRHALCKRCWGPQIERWYDA